ncbi:Gp19/Gp15/Gp42 family protein [Nocardia concava]|uniref:Gp19/Gp15/Gp42 family protein n=1 Tax=Nocardia concava TaxID=257281 RepID=UPI00030712C3|nr:Gp19/Gp15/Gp42 family protein [Nocardia concava]
MAAFATYTDLAAYWRPLTPEEQAKATTLLDYAASIIRAEWPDIDARITAGFDPKLPKLVSLAMVKRAMLASNAEGVSATSQTAGPYAQSQTFTNPTGNLYLTASERRMLSPGGTRRKAFTVNTMPTGAGTGLPYWDSATP